MATFIKLTLNINGSVSNIEEGVAVNINLDHVVRISRDQTGKGSKISYANGQIDRVFESLDLIERLIRGEDVGRYIDPGEPNPREA